MIYRLLVAVALCALSAASVHSQSAPAFSGRVVDAATGDALPGAAVALPSLSRGVIAGADGRFSMAGVPADTVTVVVSFVGFETFRQLVRLPLEAPLDVRLAPTEDLLGEVEVTADAAQERLGRDSRAVDVLDAEDLAEIRGASLG